MKGTVQTDAGGYDLPGRFDTGDCWRPVQELVMRSRALEEL